MRRGPSAWTGDFVLGEIWGSQAVGCRSFVSACTATCGGTPPLLAVRRAAWVIMEAGCGRARCSRPSRCGTSCSRRSLLRFAPSNSSDAALRRYVPRAHRDQAMRISLRRSVLALEQIEAIAVQILEYGDGGVGLLSR